MRWGQLMSVSRRQAEPKTRATAQDNNMRRRLVRTNLGRHAHEDSMPDWLAALLRTKGEIKTEGVVPVLKQLLEQNNTTQYAYLCHESVQHISKLKLEGGFCGYRNIQMLISYIIATGFEGQEHFQGRLPTIFEIQDFIENAWDRGINVQGRVETGGIRGTRKYIGTAEAQALCRSLAIPCTAQAFSDKKAGESEARLLEAIETYFQMGASLGASKVVCTTLAPVYFQHAGHSMTIIGFERRKHGTANLLVFDPSHRDTSAIRRLIGTTFGQKTPDSALETYRRGHKYLRRFREYELLRLDKTHSPDRFTPRK